MKKIVLCLMLLVSALGFSSCRPIRSEMFVEDINRNSNFEINLLTPAVEADFSDFNTVPGMGVTGYYNKKYGDMDVDYDAVYACYVQYDVTCYPDVAFGEQCVTGIRITDPDLQNHMFRALGLSQEEAQQKFGFLLDAFRYGAPPHGGMGIGLDRLIMQMVGAPTLRDVIAYPKVQNMTEPMTDCPSVVDDQQLLDLGIGILPQE